VPPAAPSILSMGASSFTLTVQAPTPAKKQPANTP